MTLRHQGFEVKAFAIALYRFASKCGFYDTKLPLMGHNQTAHQVRPASKHLLDPADKMIERSTDFAAVHESDVGTKRPFYACRRMSVLGGKAVVQRTSLQ
jgi:hypothetical protein